MDGLSALKMMLPQGMGDKLTKVVQDAGASKPISAAELSKLNPTSRSPAIDGMLPPGGTAPVGTFSKLLGNFVSEVSEKQAVAGDAVNGLLSGKNVSLHQAMISM